MPEHQREKVTAPSWLWAGLVLIVIGVASCASPENGDTAGPASSATSPGTSPTAATGPLPAITVRRTGGIAGVSDELTVDAQGAWVATGKTGGQRTGQLAATDIAAVRALATDPRLAAEASRSPAATNCRDAFDYVVTVGPTRISYTDCPSDADLPAAAIALVGRLEDATA